MIKTHEINLTTTNFNQFNANDYIIVKDEERKIEINDYILFKQVEIEGEETKDTGLFKMTQVRDVITDEGLKDNYVLLALIKFE